jgi:hypothetical protein
LRFGIWRETASRKLYWRISNRVDKIGRRNILVPDRRADPDLYEKAVNRKYKEFKNDLPVVDLASMTILGRDSLGDIVDLHPPFLEGAFSLSVSDPIELIEELFEVQVMQCERIKIQGSNYGKLSFLKKRMEFIAEGELKPKGELRYFGSALADTCLNEKIYLRFDYNDVTEIWERRYLHLHTAIEIFLKSG